MLSMGRCVGGSISASKNGQVSRAIASRVLRCCSVRPLQFFTTVRSGLQAEPTGLLAALAALGARPAIATSSTKTMEERCRRHMVVPSLTLESGCRDALLNEPLQQQKECQHRRDQDDGSCHQQPVVDGVLADREDA